MEADGLNMMIWDAVERDDLDDLIEYTIHFRRKTADGYRYRIKDESIPSAEPLEVTLDGTSGKGDPLQDLMTVEMKITEGKVTEMVLKSIAYVKRY